MAEHDWDGRCPVCGALPAGHGGGYSCSCTLAARMAVRARRSATGPKRKHGRRLAVIGEARA